MFLIYMFLINFLPTVSSRIFFSKKRKLFSVIKAYNDFLSKQFVEPFSR